ncbi:glycosyltransferase involved in cell wall biosynthesis [Parabacteroides sp. PFB2-10]|uniref:glycosyltransferase n=1 Tax=Parabacteroides sp. PFB2-10 TaxID=1742405 RepID=UPI002474421E|nr:glycosyltransferase [Parabacteroides sp. PFB2-10]MDH6312733.1 glycosyltransferase involved in cell wall biosynthesis [Parabacteroides sp. PFB2-10]
MKALFLIDSLGSGGAQRQLTTIAPLLKQKGISVEVLCYHKNNFFSKPLNDNNIPIHWITPGNYLIRILKIRKFIRSGNYQAVVSFLDTPDLLNCLAAIGGHTWKVITSERSAKKEKFNSFRGRLGAWMNRYADIIVCNSENARQMWVEYYPQYRKKLVVIYNIVTIPKIHSTYHLRKDGKTHILVAASYQSLKNPLRVIEAVNLLNKDKKQQLTIRWYGSKQAASDGMQLYNKALELVNKYNLHTTIYLNDASATIVEKMNHADAVGLFSQFEGLPNAICEGMTLGKPIIMSRVSDYDLLVDEKNGFLCDWNDVDSIKSALNHILDVNNEQLILMGEYSKVKAKELFGEKTLTIQWFNVICDKTNSEKS